MGLREGCSVKKSSLPVPSQHSFAVSKPLMKGCGSRVRGQSTGWGAAEADKRGQQGFSLAATSSSGTLAI